MGRFTKQRGIKGVSKHDYSSKDFRKTKAQLIEELHALRRRVNGANDEAPFRSAVENLEDGLAFYDSEDRLVFCNEAYRRLHPAICDMLKPGVLFEDLVRAHTQRGQIPEGVGREEEYVRKRMEQHRAPKYSIVRELTNGNWFIIKEGRTSNGGTYAINTDITELKKNEQALRASQEQFRGAIANLQEGFALYDADDRLVMCNDEYRRLHPKTEHILKPGMRFEELVRTNIEHGVNADAIGCEEEHIRQRMEQHRNPGESLLRNLTDGRSYIIKESRTPDGGIVVTETDVTNRRRAEAALRDSEDRFRNLIEGSVLGIVIDTDGKPLFANQAFAQIFGYRSPDEILKMRSLDRLYTPNDVERICGYRKCRAEGAAAPTHYEFEGVKRNGTPIWLETRVRVINWKGESAVQSTVFDVTDRKLAETALRQSEEALRESEERFRAVVDNAPFSIFLKDTKGRYLLGNREFEKWHSTTSEEAEGSTVYDRFRSEDADVFANQDHRVLETRSALEEEVRLQYPDGKTRTAMVIKFPVFGPDGGAVAVGGFNIDIGDRKRAEEALKESEARFRDVAESAGDWIWEMDSDLRFTNLSQRFYELFAVAPDQILGKTRAEFAGAQTDDLRWRSHLDNLSHQKPFRNFEYAVRVPDGPTKYIRISGKPVFDPVGTFLGYRGTGTDVTAEVEAEAAAAEARARLFDAVESITAGFALFDKDDKLVLCNNRYRNLHPLMPRLAVPGMSFQEIISGVAKAGIYDPSMGEIDEFVKRRLAYHRSTPSNHEQRFSDGRCVEIQEYGTHDGGTVLLWTDVTERKLLEKQLVGAQRMEALGKLTGGVAHDFNNLLTVILGNLQLLERRVECDPRLKKCVDLAADAAARGSELTSRLLAFSRRQILRTKIICVNSLITDIEPLLRGTLGATIQVENNFADELWPVMTDATQLESALLNLVINARDAMPDGGKLVIETANVTLDDHYVTQNADVTAGHYVMIAVTDTGRGMSQGIIEHVFEPFFSTKEKGKGTGLGLSMVYGFLKQSDGHIKVYSEAAHGTVVKLYLPRAGDTRAQSVTHIKFGESVPLGDEIVLLVEDDTSVRQTAVALLEDLGYRVFQAADGPMALGMLDKHPHIDLLFTDVIMPRGMKGPELAREVRKRRPEIKVLYTSGYTDTAVVRDGQLEFGPFLSKPFQKLELAIKVREALDS